MNLRKIRRLNEELNKLLEENEEYTFADWFGQDLTGQTYDGDINCSKKGLTSLKGAPKIITGSFQCNDNNLTSLEYAPKSCEAFYCQNNKLTNLVGAPNEVIEYFNCSNNPLQSLEGLPEKMGILVAEELNYKNLDLSPINQIQVKKIMPKILSAIVTGVGMDAAIKNIIDTANKGYQKYANNRKNKGTSFDVSDQAFGYYYVGNLDFRNNKYEGKLSSGNLDAKVIESILNSINKRFNPFTLEVIGTSYEITW